MKTNKNINYIRFEEQDAKWRKRERGGGVTQAKRRFMEKKKKIQLWQKYKTLPVKKQKKSKRGHAVQYNKNTDKDALHLLVSIRFDANAIDTIRCSGRKRERLRPGRGGKPQEEEEGSSCEGSVNQGLRERYLKASLGANT